MTIVTGMPRGGILRLNRWAEPDWDVWGCDFGGRSDIQ